MMVYIVSLGIALLFFLHLFLRWKDNYWLREEIPYLEPRFLFGNVRDVILMKKTMGEVYRDIYNKLHGKPLGGFFKLTAPILMIRHPDLVRVVLQDKFDSFEANDVEILRSIDPILKMNPFVKSGAQWRSTRAILTPCQGPERIKAIIPFLAPICQDMVDYIREIEDDPVEVKDLVGMYTTDVMASFSFGTDVHSFKYPSEKFRLMTRKLFTGGVKSNIALLCAFYAPTLGNLLKLRIIPKYIAEYFIGVVAETCQLRVKDNIRREDFIQDFIEINKESEADGEGTAYNYQQIAGHSMAFLIDGYYSSCVALCFSLYDLAMHLDVQEKAREEVKRHISSVGDITYEVLEKLTYMDLIVSESLRLHPPIQTITRRCTKSTELSYNGSKYTVKKGTPVTIPTYALQMDPEYYPEPECFRPERFVEEEVQKRPPFTYLPFGGGPRVCLGARFARVQLKAALASILLNFEVSQPVPGTKIELDPVHSFFSTPKGRVPLKFNKL